MVKLQNKSVFWSVFDHADWRIYLATTDEGLCYVGIGDSSYQKLLSWSSTHLSGYNFLRSDENLHPYITEITEYLQGSKEHFSFPVRFQGTTFQKLVWQALREIPYGQTRSYSDIALHIQKPTAVRAVGAAIGANPLLIVVPCHRVIGKNGALTGYRDGIDTKTNLLQLEASPVAK